jgi:hypothetical protein
MGQHNPYFFKSFRMAPCVGRGYVLYYRIPYQQQCIINIISQLCGFGKFKIPYRIQASQHNTTF